MEQPQPRLFCRHVLAAGLVRDKMNPAKRLQPVDYELAGKGRSRQAAI